MGRIARIVRPACAAVAMAAVLGMAGCNTDLLDRVKEITATPYAAGAYSNGSKWIPCYWKGTTRVDLTGDSGSLGISDSYAAKATCIAITADGVIHVGGQYQSGSTSVACYWTITNGTIVRTDLSGGAGATQCSQLETDFDSAGNAYTAGFWRDSTGYNHACYWVNGTRHDVETGASTTVFTTIGAINEQDGKLYMAGWHHVGTDIKPFVVVDGTLTDLYVLSSSFSMSTWQIPIYGVEYYNGVVYVAGSMSPDPNTTLYAPFYWTFSGTTGPYTALTAGSSSYASQANWCTHIGSDFYVNGWWSNGTVSRACFWKNGTRVDLPGTGGTATGTLAESVSFLKTSDAFYVSGNYNDGSKLVPCCWQQQADGSWTKKADFPGDGSHDARMYQMIIHQGVAP